MKRIDLRQVRRAASHEASLVAYDERGTRGDGQKAMKELEEKYLRLTNETNRAMHAELAATFMEPEEDADLYIMQATRLRSRLAANKDRVTDRHFTDITVQGLPESYRDIKLMTYNDPDFNQPKIQNHETLVPGRGYKADDIQWAHFNVSKIQTMRHLYLGSGSLLDFGQVEVGAIICRQLDIAVALWADDIQ